ncbi:MAG: DnaJ domain-containing protein [Pseudomonadota bacterium]
MWKIIWPVVLTILYTVSPYDILPDFILGWGWIDDVIVLWFLWRFLKKIKEAATGSGSEYGRPRPEPKGEETHRDKNESAAPGGRREATPDAHTILGVSPGASPDEIKQAYRRLANQYHPDKVAYLGEEFRVLAEKRFKEIQEAYEELIPR